ncbi:CarD family transcriptional regulator [Leucobacter sp. GX24907]
MNLEALDTYALALTIPVDQYAASGVRNVISGESLDELFGTLSNVSGEEPENWSRRFKANELKVRSGSVLRLAEVVRDLLRRDEVKTISRSERHTLSQGMSQLAREVFYSKNLESVDIAEQSIKDAALGIPLAL